MYRLSILLLIPIAYIILMLGYDILDRVSNVDIKFTIEQTLIIAAEVIIMIILGYGIYETVKFSLGDLIK